MVHRSADSRLLTNLLTHEKEYSKHLTALHDLSNNSLASFAAYAAASGQQTSGVVLSVAGSLAAADEALRRYGQGVDEWKESMRALKELEEEVGNIMRDREILVTRVIKASRSSKNAAGSIRDSLLLNHQTFTSASSLSLTSSPPDSPSPGASRPLSITSLSPLPSNPKLLAAQSELQACETHLASKEHELAVRRCTALKDGLGARMKAMAECGWAWGEIGREAGRVLDGLGGVKVEGREGEVNGTGNESKTSSPLVRNPMFTAQDMNRQSGHYSIPEPQVSHYMAGAEQHFQQQHNQHQHAELEHQQQLHQQYSHHHQQQQHTGQYPAAPEIMESPMGAFSALGPVQSSSQHQQPQEGQLPPPVSILSLVDPGVAFGVSRSETQTHGREDQVGEDEELEGDEEEHEEAGGEEGEEREERGEGHTRVPTSTTTSTVTHFSEGTVMECEHVSRLSESGLERPSQPSDHSAHPSTSEPTTSVASAAASSAPPPIPFPSAPKADDRPPSNASSGTAASSLYYTPVTPTTYTTETISYAAAIAVHVGPGSAGHSSLGHGSLGHDSLGGGHEVGGQPLGVDEIQPVPSQHQYDHPIPTAVSGERAVSPYAPLSRKEYFEEDLHRSVKIPPAHAIGEYDMPVISPHDSLHHHHHQQQQQQRGRDGSPAKRNSLLMRLGSLGGGGSGRSSSPSQSPGPGTPVVESVQVEGGSGFTRHVLERRITEEEGGVSLGSQPGHGVQSQPQPHQEPPAGQEDDASEESDERWAKEGELNMVENPRFMSEERKRELARKKEKEEARRVKEEEKARAKEEKSKDKTKDKDKGKGKQKEAPESDADTEGEDQDTPKPSKTRNRQISFVKQKKAAESLSTVDDSTHAHTQTSSGKVQASPSKGFLGSIKGLFSARHDAPGRKEHRRAMSEVVPSSTKAGGEEGERAAAAGGGARGEDSDDDSSIVERSPTKTSGFHLFGGKKKGNTKEVVNSKWETRTDKNLKKLEAAAAKSASSPAGRKFSLDERGRAGAGAGGVAVVEHEGGGVQRVMRAASVTASGSNASLLSDARNERDRKKLRKTRGGAVQGGVTGVPGGQQQDDKTPVPKKTPTTNEPAGVVTPVRRAPSQAVRPAQQQQGQQGPPTKTGLSHRRSASIDVGVQQRRSFVESEARKTNAENEMRRGEVSHGSGNHSSGEGDRRSYADASSENGTVNGIVDLGSRRRRAASEAGRRELQQYGAMDNVPPVPSHEPVLMGYVPTAPGSVLGTVHVQPTPVHVERTPAPPAPKPIHLEPYVRPKEAQTSAEVGGAQRATSILKTRKSSSDVGQPTTSASTTAYPPPMPMKTPTAPPPVVAQTSTSPPLSRRQSTRAIPATSTSSPSKAQPQLQAQITSPKKTSASPSKLPTSAPPSKLPTSATSPNRATVLPAGGDHPSGILVAQAGWNAPQSTLTGTAGGAISRNTSVRSAASAPSGDGMGVPQSRGAAGKRQKQSVLGQGMPTTTISGGVGRHASLGHTSGVVMGQQFQQQYPPAQQQQQTSPQSLLKIIEDVANVNKKGPLSGGIGIPSAPPRVLTEKLKAMDQDAFRSQLGASPIPGQRHGATHGARTKAPSTATTTTTASQGLWEIKAPGSVWDQRQALMEQQTTSKKPSGIYNKEASMSAPDLTLSGVSRSRSVKSPRPVAAAAGGGQMPNGNVTGSHSASSSGVPQPAKMPLRSAMRHPSRTPSPLVSGSPHARAGSGPASTSSYNSPLTRHEPLAAPATSSPQHQPSPLVREVEKKKDKGKQKAVEPEQEDTGAESSAYETGNEAFYTDEESGAEGRWKEKEKKPILAAPVPFGGPSTLSGMNGHAVGYGASDVSRSDTSTGTPRASSDQQQPRRRKSVRVSLKPTFSPSPPAIEYDEYEEQERHAPWAWGPKAGSSSQYDSIEKRASEQPGSSSSLYNPAIASPAPQAPAKQHAIVKQQKAESSKDIWEDSSDDDEAYFKAKKALSEAAKFEKDVTLMVANRRF